MPDDAELSLDDLDDRLLSLQFDMLLEFLITTTDSHLSCVFAFSDPCSGFSNTGSSETNAQASFLHGLLTHADNIMRYLFTTSYDQYIVLSPRLSVGFFDAVAVGIMAIVVLYNTTFKRVRRAVRVAKRANFNVVKTHRIIFFHLALLAAVLLMDAMFAAVMILIGALAMVLVPAKSYHIGILSSFICGISALQLTVCYHTNPQYFRCSGSLMLFVAAACIAVFRHCQDSTLWNASKCLARVPIGGATCHVSRCIAVLMVHDTSTYTIPTIRYIAHAIFIHIYALDFYLKENRVVQQRRKRA